MALQCRSCLNRNPLQFVDMEVQFLPEVTTHNYYHIFNYFTRLEASPDDLLPGVLCDSCARELQSAYEYVEAAKRANLVLRENLLAANASDQEKRIRLSDVVEDTFTVTEETFIEAVELEEPMSGGEVEYLDEADDEAMYIANEQESCVQTEITTSESISHETAAELYAVDLLDDKYLIEFTTDAIPDAQGSEKYGNKWKCIECKRVLRGDVSYVGHMNWHKGARPYKCKHCELGFRCKEALEHHDSLRHQESQHTTAGSSTVCTIELAEVYEEFDENLHSQQDVSETTTEHQSRESQGQVNCGPYQKQLTKQNLLGHMESHQQKDSQEYICSFCPRVCKNKNSLCQHEKVHKETEEDTLFVCTDCDRPYKTQSLYVQHRKQAHKERDNVCPLCGNAFKLKNQLRNHMKLHLEKNIHCTMCDKKYARSVDLAVHMRTHTGEMPYTCHLCDRSFAIKVRLTYHLQKHYGIKHICKECGAEFNSKQKLKAHSYKHTGMPYRCETCRDRGFANRDVFKRHLQRVHSIIMTNEELYEMFQRNTGKASRVKPIEELDDFILQQEDIINSSIDTKNIDLTHGYDDIQ